MAKQICILGYVIAIILILSNVKNVSSNKNNQYAMTPTTTTTTTATATEAIETTTLDIGEPFHTSTSTSASASLTNAYPMSKMVTAQSSKTSAVETKSISALHGKATEFMQQTLHNKSLTTTINEELSMQRHHKHEVHKPIEQSQNDGTDSSKIQHQQQQHYMVHSDAKNPKKQLLSSALVHNDGDASLKAEQRQQQQPQHNDYIANIPLVYHDKFMNENKKALDVIESTTADAAETVETTTVKVMAFHGNEMQSLKHNQPLQRINDSETNDDNNSNNGSDGDDDSRKSDEMMAMPMKILRDNVNATSDAGAVAAIRFHHSSNDNSAMKVNKTSFTDDSGRFNANDADTDAMGSAKRVDTHLDPAFNVRSRYLETDLDFDGGELHDEQSGAAGDVNVNDQLDWASDANKFEELSLNDDFDDDVNDDSDSDNDGNERDGHHKVATAAAAAATTTNMQARSWASDLPDIESHERINATATPTPTQNILKISKPNKSKSIKHMPIATAEAVVSASAPPQPPQPLLEIRLSKQPPMTSSAIEKEFINSHSFPFITELYDQYEWNADELRHVLSRKCASEMYVFLEALERGKTWAAKGKLCDIFSLNFQLTYKIKAVKLKNPISITLLKEQIFLLHSFICI